jgi:type I restriction enzyme S subunit
MSPDRLLQYFEQISEAPDAVPRLRRFILDLAVRGILVERDPTDEPATVLLTRIEAEKKRLANAGEIRKEKPLPPIDEDATPFDLPATWGWVPIRQIATDRGQKIPKQKFSYIDVSAINKERGIIVEPQLLAPDEAPSRARKIVRRGDVIYSCVRPYLLNVAVVNKEFEPEPIVSTAFAVLNGLGLVLPRYLWIVLRSPYFVGCVEEKMRGQAYPAINDTDFALLPVPLPPLAEQHRIVEKVDELMALCDDLEAAQTKRERRRDRLVAATLHGLNSGDASADPGARPTFQDSARFYFNHLPRLTTRPEHIHQLRQTILSLAVRGRLIRQDPMDEPASELLARIRTQKARLEKEEKIGRRKSVEATNADTTPCALPEVWAWVRLGDLTELITKGSSPKWQGVDYVPKDDGILFVTSENVGNYRLRKLDEAKYVEKRFNEIEPRSILRHGDLLMNLVGASIGRTAVYDLHVEANINQAVALIRLIKSASNVNLEFLLHYLNSPSAIDYMLAAQVVTAQPNISLTNAREFPVPLPPLAEQHRIVAKVDELMALCDDLEARLTTTAITRRQLLEASLAETLEEWVPDPFLLDRMTWTARREENGVAGGGK